jgi:TnpA family transposase
MVKYVTAVRLGTAETESILRRFVRSNIQHPTYKAFSELGRAIKTIFLCQYLHSEAKHCKTPCEEGAVHIWV